MVEIEAPAKINLSFKILGKRPDAFHEIDTVMVPVTLEDRLILEKTQSDTLQFDCDTSDLPTDGSNLVQRVAALFFSTTKIKGGVNIRLFKKIPHGAGLGGGSSDAAATLIGLNRLFDTQLPLASLSEMAASIGSDIPFFLVQGAARCCGRGEIVTPLPAFPRLPLLLIKPPFSIATPWAYQHWADSKELDGIPYAAQPLEWGILENDLERPVFWKYLLLAELKHWLLQQPQVQGALLSGSGSTLFAVLHNQKETAVLKSKISEQFGKTFWIQPAFIC